ncbi:hypothetical protein GQ457_08G034920 [Hibiscus cannabinus]
MQRENANHGVSSSSSNTASLESKFQDFMATFKVILQENSTLIRCHGAMLQTQGTLLQNQGAMLHNQGPSLQALETQVGKITQALNVRPQGSLPSDTEATKVHGKEHCNAITQRSGTQLNKDNKFKGGHLDASTPKNNLEDLESPMYLPHLQEEPRPPLLTTRESTW